MKIELLVPFLCLIPLAAAFVNRPVVFVGMVLSWAGLAGAWILRWGMSGQDIMIGQTMLLSLVSVLAVHYSKARTGELIHLSHMPEVESLATLKREHAILKSDVALLEKEESFALQIYGAAKSLAEALSWKDMAPRLTSAIQKIFGAYEFLLYALNEEGGWTLLLRRGGWTQEPPMEGHLPEQVTFFKPPACTEVVPVLAIPVLSMTPEGLQTKGALFMKSPIGEKSEEDLLRLGREFGQQLGLTLSKALLFSQMEEHSRVDGLTGVLRRQAFMDRLSEEFKRARVFHTPFSLMMVDIDHFKNVNDQHGHAAGDAVLRRVGEILKKSVYETDVVGRYGGEEFILLLPKAEPEGVRRKAEMIRQHIERDVVASGFEHLRVTVSLGLAHFPQHGSTPENLIRSADQAMYEAKESGRNLVVEA